MSVTVLSTRPVLVARAQPRAVLNPRTPAKAAARPLRLQTLSSLPEQPRASVKAAAAQVAAAPVDAATPAAPRLYTNAANSGYCMDIYGVVKICAEVDVANIQAKVVVSVMGIQVGDAVVSPSHPLNIDVDVGVVRLVASIDIRDYNGGHAVYGTFKIKSFIKNKTWEGVIFSWGTKANAPGGLEAIDVADATDLSAIIINNTTTVPATVNLSMMDQLDVGSTVVDAGKVGVIECPGDMLYSIKAQLGAAEATTGLVPPGSTWKLSSDDGTLRLTQTYDEISNGLGKSLTIRNESDTGLEVEWRTKGGWFHITSYNIAAHQNFDKAKAAVWYDVNVRYTDPHDNQVKKIKKGFYGGAHAEWTFHGNYTLTG